jgi:hypothetical protein
MERLRDYASGKYKIEFKDKRIEYFDLSAKEIMFFHKNMGKLNIGRWEIQEEVPCGIFTSASMGRVAEIITIA